MEIKRVAVIGSGTMGHGIAEVFGINGYHVNLEDVSEDLLRNAFSRMKESLEKLSKKGSLGNETVDNIIARITTHTSLESAAKDADLLVEAIPEIESLKIDLLTQIEGYVRPEAIITSCTSNIRITDLAKNLKKRDRFAGFHFFNPPVLMRLVEVIKGEETADETVQVLLQLAKSIGKTPVKVAKDSPGFIVNRVNAPDILLLGQIVDKGIATPPEVDAFARLQGLPVGPFELMDAIGIDVVHHSLEYFAKTLSPEYAKCKVYRELFEKNQLGKKTGRGFYDWSQGNPAIDTRKSTNKISLMDLLSLEINEAVKLIEEGVASPNDIETAVKLGLNRPFGPITVAKGLSNSEVKAKLEDLSKKFECSVFAPAATITQGKLREAIEGRLKKEPAVKQEPPKPEYTPQPVPYKTLTVEKFGFKVVRVLLNRPEHNAINAEMLEDLEKAVDALWNDQDIRVILISGQGSTFSAGADLSQFFANGFQFVEFSRKGQRIFRKFSETPKITIAAVKGNALGGGFELSLACDLRVSTADAQMGLPEVRIGLAPGWGGTQRLAKLVGIGRAAEIVLTGTLISGKEANSIGIVNRLFEDIDRESLEYAKSIAENTAPIAVALAKRLVNKGTEVPMDVGLEMESFAAGVVFGTEDLKEGVSSFFQKKKPDFRGR